MGLPVKNHTEKEVLHLLLVLSITNHVFRLLDLEVEVLTSHMTFIYQIILEMDYPVEKNYILHLELAICVFLNFFITLTLELTF